MPDGGGQEMMASNRGIGTGQGVKMPAVVAYHTPCITVVIPHFNLTEFLSDALLSVRQQTYANFRCVVVDDKSTPVHSRRAREVVRKLKDTRFRFVQAPTNGGMINAIYLGIDEAPASFTCVLDPDDRYAPEFLERMLAVHLNRFAFCPIASCDQYLYQVGDGIITGTQRTNRLELLGTESEALEEMLFKKCGFHRFVPPIEAGWHWSSTSSMMFRTEALRLIRPKRRLPYKGQGDDYCANGAHMLGGSLLLHEPLVYRGLHDRNDFIARNIMSMWQRSAREGAVPMSDVAKIDVVEAFFANDGMKYFDPLDIKEVFLQQFKGEQLKKLILAVPEASALLSAAS